MKLPNPPEKYNQVVEAQRNAALELADKQNVKRLEDLEIVPPRRLILRSPNGSRWSITVSNTGTITATSI